MQEGCYERRYLFGFWSSIDSLVVFLSSLVQVSLGTVQVQSLSIPRLLTPLMSLKVPFYPQKLPQEFLTIQYLVPFYSPQPVTLTTWSSAVLPLLSTSTPEV